MFSKTWVLIDQLRQFAEESFLPLNEANATISLGTKDYYRRGWISLETQPIANQRIDTIRAPHVDTIHVEGSNRT
jgi:hypothetical protein